jgi:hypothetical protein
MDTKGTMATMYRFHLGRRTYKTSEHSQKHRTLPKPTNKEKPHSPIRLTAFAQGVPAQWTRRADDSCLSRASTTRAKTLPFPRFDLKSKRMTGSCSSQRDEPRRCTLLGRARFRETGRTVRAAFGPSPQRAQWPQWKTLFGKANKQKPWNIVNGREPFNRLRTDHQTNNQGNTPLTRSIHYCSLWAFSTKWVPESFSFYFLASPHLPHSL